MTGPHWQIHEQDPMPDGTRVFRIKHPGRGKPSITVWFDTVGRCGSCVGRINPMHTHCAHARVINRYVASSK